MNGVFSVGCKIRAVGVNHEVPVAFTTRSSLLDRIKTGDEAAWQEFVDFYRPLIAWVARRRGLGGPDVDDIVQEVLADLFKDRERFTYDRSIGRFRDFLHLVTVRRVLKFLRKQTTSGSLTPGKFIAHAGG